MDIPAMMNPATKRRPGVTIIELMVALTAGLLLISSVYYVGAGSSRHFQEQQRITQTQMSVRMALNQLRRDIENAGLLGTPNSESEQRCMAPARELQAIQYAYKANQANIPNAAANGAIADQLILTGAYAAQEAFLVYTLDAAGSSLYLQENWQSYRRVFANVAVADLPTAYSELFQPGRMLHITTTDGNHYFVTITGSASATKSVSFAPAFTIGTGCPAGLLEGATVSVLSRIQYTIEDAATFGADANSLAPLNQQVTGDPSYLVRREIAFTAAGASIDVQPRIVLEFAVDFALDFVVDTQIAVGGAATLAIVRGAGVGTNLDDVNVTAGAWPQRVRSVMVNVAARTAEQDPRLDFGDTPAGTRPFSVFKAIDGQPGYSRVRSAHTEVFTRNIAERMLRP